MECRIYYIQYIGKSEVEFNNRLNNYCKDVNRQKVPQADQHFKLPNHNFNQRAKFTLIEQIDNINIYKDLATLRLKKLKLFTNGLNKTHKTIKFDYKTSTKQIEFLDTMVYRDEQHKIQTTIFHRPTNQQTYLHAQSNRPKSLKDSIPYSQTLRIKTICSTTSEFNKNCDIITKRFKERGYLENLVNKQVDKVKNMKRKQLLLTNKKAIPNHIPVSITYNRYLLNISKIITKNWNILQISPTLQKVFNKKPMITY